jgi:hypothetical protein
MTQIFKIIIKTWPYQASLSRSMHPFDQTIPNSTWSTAFIQAIKKMSGHFTPYLGQDATWYGALSDKITKDKTIIYNRFHQANADQNVVYFRNSSTLKANLMCHIPHWYNLKQKVKVSRPFLMLVRNEKNSKIIHTPSLEL